MLKQNLRANYITCDGRRKDIKTYYSENVQDSEKVRIDINNSETHLKY